MLNMMSVLFDYGFTHILNWSMSRRILLCDMWDRTYWILIYKTARVWNLSHWILCTYSLRSKCDNLTQSKLEILTITLRT